MFQKDNEVHDIGLNTSTWSSLTLTSQHSAWTAFGLAPFAIFQQFLGTVQKESGPGTVPHGQFGCRSPGFGEVVEGRQLSFALPVQWALP